MVESAVVPADRPLRRVAVLFHPRCGSSWLMSLLHQVPGARVHYEVLDTATAIRDGLVEPRGEPICSWPEQLAVLERLHAKAVAAGASLLAFKVAPYQCLNLPALLAHLDATATQLVFMFRRNLVRGAVSQLGAIALAQRSGSANVGAGDAPVDRLRLERSAFFQQLYELTREAGVLHAARAMCRRPHLTVYYEDLVAHPELHLAALSAHWGARLREADQGRVHRNLAPTLREAVENFDDLCAWLDGTPHAADLHDDAERGRVALPPLQLPAGAPPDPEIVALHARTARLLAEAAARERELNAALRRLEADVPVPAP